MQLPVDITAILEEATKIDEARQTPLVMAVFIDETAPSDLKALARREFSSSVETAQIDMVTFPTFPVVAVPGADAAVIVAGLDEKIGYYASMLREAGIPTMVVTTMPRLVVQIALEAGYPLLEGDVIAPVEVSEEALEDETAALESTAEPIALNKDNLEYLKDRMGAWIIETNTDKKLAFALTLGFVRRPLSMEAVRATSAQNAGIGLVVFLPGADMPLMTLNQAKMLLQIAAAYGQPMTIERVKELALVVGGAFALRAVSRQLVGLIPALGWAIKATIGYSGTFAMGRAAIEYFEADGTIAGLAQVVNDVRQKAVSVVGQDPVWGFRSKGSVSPRA